MVDQNAALWIFSVAALIYIGWIDVRPLIAERKNSTSFPGIDGESITINDAAWALLTKADPLKESFETSMDREHQRIWHCMVWLLRLGRLKEITLYGMEDGAKIYRPIDLNSPHHNFWIIEETNQVSRDDVHRSVSSVIHDEPFGECIWGDNVRVLKSDIERVIDGFNAGKIDDWVDDPIDPEEIERARQSENHTEVQ